MKAASRLRDMRPYHASVSDIRHVALAQEVQHALDSWGVHVKNGVLVGGLAMSFYAPPRYTQDIDLLFLAQEDIPDQVPEFKKTRPHSFLNNKTHVEVEVLTPAYIGVSHDLVSMVIDTAVVRGGWRVASREGLIALKIQRASRQDLADIERLASSSADLRGWPLTEKQRSLLVQFPEILA